MQQFGSDGGSGDMAGELTQYGPVARMMMSVAAHAITSYVQFRALAELLIEKGIFTRDELEGRFSTMREGALERTIDEWFTPDIAYHLKMAVQAASAQDDAAGSVLRNEADEIARARSMQGGEKPEKGT